MRCWRWCASFLFALVRFGADSLSAHSQVLLSNSGDMAKTIDALLEMS